MESEIIQTVMNEVLEELKEVKRQQELLLRQQAILTGKVETCDQKILNIKVSAAPVDTTPIRLSIADGIDKIAATVEAQPKKVVKQFRILLFPESGATEYYRLVFGRLLFWMMLFLMATYLFVLGKQLIEGWVFIHQNEMTANQAKKPGQILYKQENKRRKGSKDIR